MPDDIARTPRHPGADLLARPPWVEPSPPERWTPLIVDPVDQLEELAALLRRGLLSPEEFHRQKWKVLRPDSETLSLRGIS